MVGILARRIQLLFVCIFCMSISSLSPAQSVPNADDVFASVQKKYADGASMRVKFLIKSEDVRGSLALKRGNKYILEIMGKTIICNGKIVWNYDAAQKKSYHIRFPR